MYVLPEERKILYVFFLALLVFSLAFIIQENYEFIAYVIVVLLLLAVIIISNKEIRYPIYVLWGLLIWAVLHMLGGVEIGKDEVIYGEILYPLVGDPYNILKYDQVVHAFGFFIATLAVYSVLKKHLVRPFGFVAIGIVVFLAGLGLGALNEIIEFSMTVVLPKTNVGGYENTALDLVFNATGALAAVLVIRRIEKKRV